MGLLDFVKDVGEKLLGGKEASAETKKETEQGLVKRVQDLGLQVEGLSVEFENGVAKVTGKVDSQQEREKVILAIGNVKGVGQVVDQIAVESPAPEATMYTVKRGDTLSKISKEHYGNANKYMTIFEANKPMLKDPDKIYPGQVLRIPPLDG